MSKIIDSDVARQESLENASYEVEQLRESFNRGIETASALGSTQTVFEKRYFDLPLIMAEITAAGYIVTDQGTTYLIDWT